MSLPEIIVEGTLKSDGTLELDKKPNLAPGRVQVTLAPLPDLPADDPFWQRMRAIWEGQKARGFVPPSLVFHGGVFPYERTPVWQKQALFCHPR